MNLQMNRLPLGNPAQFQCSRDYSLQQPAVRFGADDKDKNKPADKADNKNNQPKNPLNGIDLSGLKDAPKSLMEALGKAMSMLPPDALNKLKDGLKVVDPDKVVNATADQVKGALGDKATQAIKDTLNGNPEALSKKVDEATGAIKDQIDSAKGQLDPKMADTIKDGADKYVNPAIDQLKGLVGLTAGLPFALRGLLNAASNATKKADKIADEKIQDPNAKEVAKTIVNKGDGFVNSIKKKLGMEDDPFTALFKSMGINPDDLKNIADQMQKELGEAAKQVKPEGQEDKNAPKSDAPKSPFGDLEKLLNDALKGIQAPGEKNKPADDTNENKDPGKK